MSGMERTIVVDANIEQALATIAKLNTNLDVSANKAGAVGDNLNKRY
jgi:hypothetical protein